MKKYFLLFDFDGTLADSIHLGLRIANSIAPDFGIKPFTEEQFQLLRTKSIPKALKELKIPLYKLPLAIPHALSEYRHLIHELEPFAGIPEVLKNLHEAGHRLSLLSSNTKENVNHFLAQHQLQYFDWVEGTSGILNKYNSLKRQIKKHALDKSRVIYIGDEIRDIDAAKKIGISVIAVTWGFHTAELLKSHQPDFIVNRPEEILEVLEF